MKKRKKQTQTEKISFIIGGKRFSMRVTPSFKAKLKKESEEKGYTMKEIILKNELKEKIVQREIKPDAFIEKPVSPSGEQDFVTMEYLEEVARDIKKYIDHKTRSCVK